MGLFDMFTNKAVNQIGNQVGNAIKQGVQNAGNKRGQRKTPQNSKSGHFHKGKHNIHQSAPDFSSYYISLHKGGYDNQQTV